MVRQLTLDLAKGDIGWNWTVLALLTLLSGVRDRFPSIDADHCFRVRNV